MNNKFVEQVTLVASVVKWTFYATIVGGLVGAGIYLFLQALSWTSDKFSLIPSYYLLLPLVILASSMLTKWLAPDAEGHGTDKVIESIHQRMGRIPLMVVPVKLAATVITLAGGGSAGKECPSAQIGGGIASAFASVLRLSDADRRKLVICGISAGFATVFGTPIAGALFGIEVLVLGQMFYDVLLPSFVAGIVGYHVATSLGTTYPHPSPCALPLLNSSSLVSVIMLGIWCGLIALFLIELMKLAHRLFDKLGSRPMQAVTGGIVLVIIGRFVSTSYLGLGLDTIDAGLKGTPLPVGSVLWKALATAATLSSGGNGGIVTPVFFIGTAAGNLFAQMIHNPFIAAFSAMGMVALLAGAANTPISASILAIELFGPSIAPYASIACIVSFLVVGYRSIYPSQIIGIQKSASLAVVTGRPVSEYSSANATVTHRDKSLVGFAIKGWSRIHRNPPTEDKS